ncbi:hypothetical protein [Actinomadura sp. NTSP31]|uniref:hypothetical protein n=1 Tax=Actinomadura sp. NTSP31 TaxID=1735447 RepID=UPI0035C18DEE
MPSNAAPPLNEDFRLVEGLRGQRPGAVGHVYNVYGPELVEYAEGLLGDHGRAVEAVRSALLALRVKGVEVPDAGTFRDWLYELVRDECRAPARRGRRRIVVIGAAAAVVLVAGIAAVLESGGGGKPEPAPPVAVATPEPSLPSVTVSPAQRDEQKKRDGKKHDKPAVAKPKKHRKAGPGRLAVGDGGCHGIGVAGLPRSCPVRLTAVGGTVHWAVTSVRSRGGRVSASGGGTLTAGRSTTVNVVVRPTVLCYIGGGGGGSVSFSPGGTATVSYTCWRR